jgi:hypothetical protein
MGGSIGAAPPNDQEERDRGGCRQHDERALPEQDTVKDKKWDLVHVAHIGRAARRLL